MSNNHKLLFTDPEDPSWTLMEFAGKTLIFHMCADGKKYEFRSPDDCSEDACKWCTQEPPPGFIALYKLYMWDR